MIDRFTNSNPSDEPAAADRASPVAGRIEQLQAEIAHLANEDLPPAAFYRELLSRVIAALAARGGAVWKFTADYRPEIETQIHFDTLSLEVAADEAKGLLGHDALLSYVRTSATAVLVQPGGSLAANPAARNPTAFVLALVPFAVDASSVAVLEIVQRPNTSVAAQSGYLRFLEHSGSVCAEYHRQRGNSDSATPFHVRLNQFAQAVHASLDLRATAYSITNDGRRLLGCDRLCLAVPARRGFQVLSASGQDFVHPRSALALALGTLADAAARLGEEIWHPASTDQLPPQVDQALQDYLEESHVKACAIVPLSSRTLDDPSAERRVVGVLIADWFAGGADDEPSRARLRAISEHATLAIENAQQIASIPGVKLWNKLAKTRGLVAIKNLPQTFTVLGLIAAGLLALVFVPADFEMEARGTLEPVTRRVVFARSDGVIDEIHALHGQLVHQNDLLLLLRNTALEYQWATVSGELQTTIKKLAAAQASLLLIDRGTPTERARYTQIAGEIEQLTTQKASLEERQELLVGQRADLRVTSPIDGQVATWDVAGLLGNRPVQRGQALLSVADTAGPWELELFVPDRRIGHVKLAQQQLASPMAVSFLLATDPAHSYTGRVRQVAMTSEVEPEVGAAVKVEVDVDRSALADPRPGASVVARIHCGRKSIGYVWLHEVWEFIQSRILFRL